MPPENVHRKIFRDPQPVFRLLEVTCNELKRELLYGYFYAPDMFDACDLILCSYLFRLLSYTIHQVCFSSDGLLLAAACEDKSHTVMVFRWEAGLLRCQARLGVKKALALCFSLNADELVAAGHKHFKVSLEN